MIYLDALQREDMPLIVRWRNQNPEGARTPYLLNQEMQADWYETVVCDRDSKHRYWAVRRPASVKERRELEINRPTVGMRSTKKSARAQRVWADGEDWFVGISGLTNIEWENSRAEIALMIDPERRGQGLGKMALRETLAWGFHNMGLHRIYGECYKCNGSLEFWKTAADAYDAHWHTEPQTKWWGGVWHDSFCFSISVEQFNKA